MAAQLEVRAEGFDRAVKRLKGLQAPAITKKAQRAIFKAGGRVVAPVMKREAPAGKTKRLRRSITVRAARRGIGAIVGPRPSVAPHRHLITQGTKAHSTVRIRAKVGRARPGGPRMRSDIQAFTDGGVLKFSHGHRVRGIKANPFVDRAWNQTRQAALDAIGHEVYQLAGGE